VTDCSEEGERAVAGAGGVAVGATVLINRLLLSSNPTQLIKKVDEFAPASSVPELGNRTKPDVEFIFVSSTIGSTPKGGEHTTLGGSLKRTGNVYSKAPSSGEASTRSVNSTAPVPELRVITRSPRVLKVPPGNILATPTAPDACVRSVPLAWRPVIGTPLTVRDL
jgi:hypothetical protein